MFVSRIEGSLVLYDFEGEVQCSFFLFRYQFREMQSSKIRLCGPFLWKVLERTAVTLNMCSYEYGCRWGLFGGVVLSQAALFSVFHACLRSTQLHTKCCNNAWLCLGTTRRNVLPLHKWLVWTWIIWRLSHNWDVWIRNSASEFPFLFLPPSGIPTQRNTK